MHVRFEHSQLVAPDATMKRSSWHSGARMSLMRTVTRLSRFVRARRVLVLVVTGIIFAALTLFTSVPFLPHLNFGSPKYVIVLGANQGGGVLQWKGAKNWDLEKVSIANKKDYVTRHGYHLAIKDMTAKRRYTHEWRESWEKVDIIRETMRQFPRAEWFWWLDLNTYIMEPQKRLESHIFSHLDELERNCSSYNPANFDLDIQYVDYSQPINMILTQDCSGFSLGSFFIRRSEWSDLLLDVMWDPTFYEQKHMEWIHSEQSALEYLYRTQAWVRSSVAFADQRLFNSYPQGACGDAAGNKQIFYQRRDRDFTVNLAGCEWGRDCWAEIMECKQVSQDLHRRKFLLF